MVFSTCLRLCKQNHYQIPENFHHPKINFVPLGSHSLYCPSPPPQLLPTPSLISVSKDLITLDMSYKWNHKICGLFCLASFT